MFEKWIVIFLNISLMWSKLGMRILKYFWYLLVIITFWFFGTMASGEECEAPYFNYNNNEIHMDCIFINGKSFKANLKFKGVDEWELDRGSIQEQNCDWKSDNCVTVSGTSSDLYKNYKNINLVKLPQLDFRNSNTPSNSSNQDASSNTNLKKIITLHLEDSNTGKHENSSYPSKPGYESSEFSFKTAGESDYQPGLSKSYGTLQPLPELDNKLPLYPVGGEKSKLLVIYMVGSDLENTQAPKDGNVEGGLGTKDLSELIQGYKSLSRREDIDVIIAYGGSSQQKGSPLSRTLKMKCHPSDDKTENDDKPENNFSDWKGVKFAKFIDPGIVMNDELGNQTTTTIGKVNEEMTVFDQLICNDNLYEESRANMGDKSTLRHFLEYVMNDNNFSKYQSKFLIFWGHGGSYNGFGNDQVYDMDSLSLTEISEAFNEAISEVRKDNNNRIFDLIGFDACLMGSIEVADIIKPYAKYLLASQDLESGEGWNWNNVIAAINNNNEIINFASNVIDDFRNGEKAGVFNKTLSFVDLDKFNDVKEKFNVVASTAANAINNYSGNKDLHDAFLKAAVEARSYGKRNLDESNDRISIDWKNFAQIAKENISDGIIINELNEFINAIDKYVLYNGNDNLAYGVSFGGLEDPAPSLSGAANDFRTAFQAVKVKDEKLFPRIVSGPTQMNAKDLFEVPYIQGGIFDKTKKGQRQPSTIPFINGERAQFVYSDNSNLRSLLSLDNIEGIAAKFEDDEYIARVTTLFGIKDSDLVRIIAELEAYPTDKKGVYFTPFWNNHWYTVKTSDNKNLPVPLSFQYRYTREGNKQYTYYSTDVDFVDSSAEKEPSKQIEAYSYDFSAMKTEASNTDQKEPGEWVVSSSKEIRGRWQYNSSSSNNSNLDSYIRYEYIGKNGLLHRLTEYTFKDKNKEEDISVEFQDSKDSVIKSYYCEYSITNSIENNEPLVCYITLSATGELEWIFYGEKYQEWYKEYWYYLPENIKTGWFGPIKHGRLDLLVDDNGVVKGHEIHIYKQLSSEDENGEKDNSTHTLFEKGSIQIETGDSVSFYQPRCYPASSPNNNDANNCYSSPSSDFIEFKEKPEFKITPLNNDGGSYVVAMRAENLAGKPVRTKFFDSTASTRPEPPEPNDVNISTDDDKTCTGCPK